MSLANEAIAILSAFRPNRAFRRANAGARCNMCGLGIVAVDLALVEYETTFGRKTTQPIHNQCTALLWDLHEELTAGEEDVFASDPGVEGTPEAEGR